MQFHVHVVDATEPAEEIIVPSVIISQPSGLCDDCHGKIGYFLFCIEVILVNSIPGQDCARPICR